MSESIGRSFGLVFATAVMCGGLALQTPPAPPAPDRPNVPQPQRPSAPPQRQQQQQNPGQQFRLPPGVEYVPDVVYAVVEGEGQRGEGTEGQREERGEEMQGDSPSPLTPLPGGEGSVAPDASQGHALLMNTFFPKQTNGEPLPVIIYIHGGGVTGGSREIGNQTSAILALGGYFTCTIDYRLLGDAPFPAAIHDCKAAVRFLRANAEELGIDPNRMGVWGHSAGGHLAAFLGTSGNEPAPEIHGDVGDFDELDAKVTCVVDFFGPSDFTTLRQTARADGEIPLFREAGRSWSEEELRTKLLEASPIHWVDAEDPPVLIFHGSEDRVVALEQSQKFHEALSVIGVASELNIIAGAGHGIRDAQTMLRTAEFFDLHLGGNAVAVFERLQRDGANLPGGN